MVRVKQTPKQKKFVEEYLLDLNATQAAIRAGYSKKTAKSQGQRLLTNVDIQAQITKLRDKLSAKSQVTRERILEEYRRIAFGDIRQVVTWDANAVTLTPSDDLSPEDAATISDVSQRITEKSNTVAIKQHSKPQALEGIRKMMGYDVPEEHNVNIGKRAEDHTDEELTAIIEGRGGDGAKKETEGAE